MSLLTEYDEEETMGYVRRDAYRDGEKAGIEQGLKQGLKQGEMLMLISMVNKKMHLVEKRSDASFYLKFFFTCNNGMSYPLEFLQR